MSTLRKSPIANFLKLSLNVGKSNFLTFSFLIKHKPTVNLNINNIPLTEKEYLQP